MNKRQVVLLVSVLVLAREVTAETVNVSQLRTPSAPGFVLLGVEPESVDRPLDPRDVGISFLTSAAQSENLIPQNYALEVAPYWLKQRRYLTFSDMFTAGVGETIKQTFSLSLAFASGVSGLDSTETGLGLGARFAIYRGRGSHTDTEALEELKNIDEQILDIGVPDTAEDTLQIDSLSSKAKELSRTIGNSRRLGFNLDIAIAMTSVFPASGLGDGEFGKVGAWITPAWVARRVECAGVVRYIHDERGNKDDVFDLGLRLVGRHRAFALSIEALSRQSADTSDDDERVAGIFEYQVGENNYFIATFGQDFGAIEGAERLLATAGITFGFGDKPVVTTE